MTEDGALCPRSPHIDAEGAGTDPRAELLCGAPQPGNVTRVVTNPPAPDLDIDIAALRAGLLWNVAMPLSLHVRRIMTRGGTRPVSLPMIGRCWTPCTSGKHRPCRGEGKHR